uniref:Uncharacterized protein n=1 Tax=Oryza sativa subsp. japonica TaxID=39947 RepID=Q6EPK5_ORYSJ|nr:hypothetical protein [Oryza sativa Japonica Group]BAD29415.1 hypothetical protein [Oryza sativa Japonica Group]
MVGAVPVVFFFSNRSAPQISPIIFPNHPQIHIPKSKSNPMNQKFKKNRHQRGGRCRPPVHHPCGLRVSSASRPPRQPACAPRPPARPAAAPARPASRRASPCRGGPPGRLPHLPARLPHPDGLRPPLPPGAAAPARPLLKEGKRRNKRGNGRGRG